MIWTDESVLFIYNKREERNDFGIAIGFLIDNHLLYDIPAWKEWGDLVMNADEIIDISTQYPNHSGITVAFKKNNVVTGEFQTTEYFGSILLSNPMIVDLEAYPNGAHVIAPYAKLIDGRFESII